MTLNIPWVALERMPYWLRLRLGPFGLVDIQLNRDSALHVWIGPVGGQVFWPQVWKSRLAWCPEWREPLE